MCATPSRRANHGRIALITLLGMVAALALQPPRPAQATALTPFIDLQEAGLTLTEAGVGLTTLGAGTAALTVNVGGVVRFALLYWAGRDRPCPTSGGLCTVPTQPYRDQAIVFDGTPITGTIIGTEAQPVSGGGPINNIAYYADVTSIVAAKGVGTHGFTFADGDLGSNLWVLSGASLVVAYTDAANPAVYRLLVHDGLDFASGADPTPGATRVTEPVLLNHGAIAGNRSAQLLIIAGGGTAARPDQIAVSNRAPLVNALDGSDGAAWDSDSFGITIPSGTTSTTVQLLSAPADQNPDEMLWVATALRGSFGHGAVARPARQQGLHAGVAGERRDGDLYADGHYIAGGAPQP
ncbi:MAG: hypothetical protein U0531_19380 [Dehalococcoidia bacterium]